MPDHRRQDTDGIWGLAMAALTVVIIAIVAASIMFFNGGA